MTSKWAAGAMSLTVAYFAYHAFAGQQGLGAWTDKQAELAEYWIQAAMWSFTPELWDRMILDAGSCLECHGYEALTEC